MVAVATERSVGPGGVCRQGVRVLGLPAGVRAAARAFPSVARVTFERAEAMVRALARDLSLPVGTLDPRHHALVCFADVDADVGTSGLLAAALASAGPHLPVVGGTFGGVALNGRARRGGAVVVLLASEAPLAPLYAHPFEIGGERLVVTDCDATGRRVSGLDGWPAAERFAALGGIAAGDLAGTPREVLERTHAQLAWVLGGRTVLRPVIGLDPEGALLLDGPVRTGAVLRVAQRRPDVAAALLDSLAAELRTASVRPAAAWAFACGGFLDGVVGERVAEGLERLGVLACSVRGAFHGPTHACACLSGLVFGNAGPR